MKEVYKKYLLFYHYNTAQDATVKSAWIKINAVKQPNYKEAKTLATRQLHRHPETINRVIVSVNYMYKIIA